MRFLPQVDRKAQTRPVAVSAEVEGCSWGRHRDIQDGVTASDLDPGSDQRVENLTMGSDRMMRRVEAIGLMLEEMTFQMETTITQGTKVEIHYLYPA